MCIQTSQATCTYNDSCFLLINTGQEIIDSENGLLTTIGFKLGQTVKSLKFVNTELKFCLFFMQARKQKHFMPSKELFLMPVMECRG